MLWDVVCVPGSTVGLVVPVIDDETEGTVCNWFVVVSVIAGLL